MKKIWIVIAAMFLLVGCSSKKKDITFMITRDQTLYALYNQAGEQLTDYLYTTYQLASGIGYIVTNQDNQVAVISAQGEDIIPFGQYTSIEATDKMLYATKQPVNPDAEKQATENTFVQSDLYVLNNRGQELYSATEKKEIMKSGLPIIRENGTYIVLYQDGKELYNDVNTVKYAYQYQNSSAVILGYETNQAFYYFGENDGKSDYEITINEKGHFDFLAMNVNGAVLNDPESSQMVYVDFEKQAYYQNPIAIESAEFDSAGNILLKAPEKTFIYMSGAAPVLMTSYYMSATTYISRSVDIYGPHYVTKDGLSAGEFVNCQLYPGPSYIAYGIFPVYTRDKGYQYYNFDNKKVIDKIYLSAEPFDMNGRAIVKEKDEGYSLIDETGKVLTKEVYTKIRYLGNIYYAAYYENGAYGIVDKDGQEIFPVEYTSLSDKPIAIYDQNEYLILGKNGRTFVYDITKDLKEIFSKEGNVILHNEGYFQVGNEYYTFEGERIK